MRRVFRKEKDSIVKLLEKELKIVLKGYYWNMWMVIGMSVFGVVMGIVFGVVLDNMVFFGLGILIGMSIGMVIGVGMDEKVVKEGC